MDLGFLSMPTNSFIVETYIVVWRVNNEYMEIWAVIIAVAVDVFTSNLESIWDNR